MRYSFDIDDPDEVEAAEWNQAEVAGDERRDDAVLAALEEQEI